MHFLYKLINIFNKKKKRINNYCSFSTTKHSIGANYTLKFSVETDKKKQKISAYLKKLISKYITTPEKLIQFMQLKGMKVYKLKNAAIILSRLREEEGFITPLRGVKALILSLIINIIYENKFKMSFSTNEMFIFDEGMTEIYTIARALYKYYSHFEKLPGMDYKSQELFKKVYFKLHNNKSTNFEDCRSIRDMYACKEAIARDMESIDFAIELSLEHERSQKALLKLQTEKSANV